MATKNGYININFQVSRILHEKLKEKYTKFPEMWNAMYRMFLEIIADCSDATLKKLTQFDEIIELVNEMKA